MNSEKQTLDWESTRAGFLRWARRVFGPAPSLIEMNLACWGLFIGLLLTRFCYSLWVQSKTGVGSIHILPGDFVYYYGIGHIANEYPLTKLYDYSLQSKIFNHIFPLHEGAYSVSPYPPFVALFFSLFARVPFLKAFFLWAGVSLALYLTGIAVVVKDIFPGERLKTSLILCFALAYSPFLYNTLANGQIASVAVCSVGLAISKERHAKQFSSGLALAVLAYKPSLLLLLIPMLLLTRRFRTIFGFITGVAVLVIATTAYAGMHIWPAYAHFLGIFSRVVGFKGQPAIFLWQYIDIRACVLAAWGPQPGSRLILFALATSMIVAGLAVLLWKSAVAGRPAQNLAWAVTLTWTLLLNIYVPVYDSILISIAAVLTLGALRDLKWSLATWWTTVLLVFISAASWETDALGLSHSGQLLSIMLAVFGLVQIYILLRVVRRERSQTPSAIAAA